MYTAEQVIEMQNRAKAIDAKVTEYRAKSDEKLKQMNEILAKYGVKTVQELAEKRALLYQELEKEYNECVAYINETQPKIVQLEASV